MTRRTGRALRAVDWSVAEPMVTDMPRQSLPKRTKEILPTPLVDRTSPPPIGSSRTDLFLKAATALRLATKTAVKAGDSRAESYAWGYLGSLYETDGRYDEALDVTRRALFAAQKVTAPESLYRWHWQVGRLLRKLDNEEKAVSAYQRAIYTLQPIRNEFVYGYRGTQFSFRKSVGPLFYEFADLLLQRAGAETDEAKHQAWLLRVRDVMEAFKTAEMEDYFRDACVGASIVKRPAMVSKTAAIIYPIILPDRLELLVALHSGLT